MLAAMTHDEIEQVLLHGVRRPDRLPCGVPHRRYPDPVRVRWRARLRSIGRGVQPRRVSEELDRPSILSSAAK